MLEKGLFLSWNDTSFSLGLRLHQMYPHSELQPLAVMKGSKPRLQGRRDDSVDEIKSGE